MRRKSFYQKATAAAIFLIFVVSLATSTHAATDEEFDEGLDDEVQDEFNGGEEREEIVYESPSFDPEQFYFVDHFDNVDESRRRWVKSQAKKDDIPEDIAKYDGEWNWESPQRIVWKNDKGLVLKSKAKHAAISAKLSKVFNFKQQKPLVVQYEVQLQEGQECGGSYIKLLSHGSHLDNLSHFNDKTPYTIMFGPDKCGNDIKMHFIFRHVNPINGSITEKHCRKAKDRLEEPFKDKMPHLYQLVVRPDNTFEISVDHKIINEGSLLTEFSPPVNPPQDIDDPKDKKPADWDEREKIPDPAANKPDDWDEDAPPQIPDPTAVKPEGWLDDEEDMIPDPSAEKPEDWDTEIDGDWEAPLVDNPVCEKAPGCGKWSPPLIPNKEYKGKWRAPLIDNPNYQGKWAPRKIPNPDFFEDLKPFQMTPIAAVGIELWSMSSDILFDNLIITDDVEVARDFAAKSFDIKRKYIAKESDSFLNKMLDYANEYPMAWKIGLVLLIAPLAFSFYTFMSKGGKKEVDPKKTDAVQPDDPIQDSSAAADDLVEVADAETETVSSTTTLHPDVTTPTKPKKSDLDVKVADEDPNDDEAEDIPNENENEKEIENENEATVEESPEAETTTAQKSSSARKRHLRKD